MEKSLYLIINISAVSIPFLFSYHKKIQFHKFHKTVLASMFLTTAFFLLWDIPFTSNGIWGFSENYTLGVVLFGLPLEEIVFFICILYACLFTYFSIKKLSVGHTSNTFWKTISYTIGALLLLLGLYFHTRAYTAICLISTGILLLICARWFYTGWEKAFFVSYFILLIPFLIVNGLLTGFSLEEPIVWYNNDHNLGIRILTIPIEDSVYAFEMILLSVLLFEQFSKRRSHFENSV